MANNRHRLIKKLKHKQFLSDYPYDINSMYPHTVFIQSRNSGKIKTQTESISSDIVMLKRHEIISERKRLVKEYLNSAYNKKYPN